MHNDELILGIAIDLPQDIANKIMEAKRSIGLVYKDYDAVSPHITLYMCRFDQKKFEKLKAKLAETNIKPIESTLTEVNVKYNRNRENYFFSIHAAKDDAMMSLHEQVMAIANPLRDGLIRTKDEERIASGHYEGRDAELIQQYGYVRVMEKFMPHATLGESDTKEQAAIMQEKLEAVLPYSFTINHINIHLYGQDPETGKFRSFGSERIAL